MSRTGVRILGGRWRGRRLQVPKGARPTESRVREALFGIWAPRLSGARVLDLFAGSGAVGLEALSRGAESATLVDASRAALGALKQNRETLGASASRVMRCRLPAPRQTFGTPGYDLIFADPPYAFEPMETLIEGLAAWLADDGELVVEHSARRPLESSGRWALRTTRRYGESCLSFFELLEEEPLGIPADRER